MKQEAIETTLYSLSDSIPTADRREDERFLTLFRVGSLLVEGERQLCLIKNISAGGMLIRAYSKLIPGTALSVELKHGENFSGHVSWVEGHSVGIEFDRRIDVVELLSSTGQAARPRMPRVEIRCMASVRQGAQIYGMLARDISQGGMRVESAGSLEIDSDVVVTLPGLSPIAGTIRWQRDGCYGIGFNRLLALSDVIAWLENQRAGR